MFKQIVFPRGRIHPSYKKYLYWSLSSNFISSVESVLSTHSMLSVIGQASTELTVSVNYIGKDIIGQFGGLYYMNKYSQNADKKPQKFINYAIGIEQSCIFLECMTPLLPINAFIPVAGFANIGKNIAFTSYGAINAKIIPTLAEDDNIGEIYAKISVLNTMASSSGMVVGLVIASFIPDHSTRLCIIPVLSVLRAYTYKKSIEGVVYNEL